jgi:hypothetical protein
MKGDEECSAFISFLPSLPAGFCTMTSNLLHRSPTCPPSSVLYFVHWPLLSLTSDHAQTLCIPSLLVSPLSSFLPPLQFLIDLSSLCSLPSSLLSAFFSLLLLLQSALCCLLLYLCSTIYYLILALCSLLSALCSLLSALSSLLSAL